MTYRQVHVNSAAVFSKKVTGLIVRSITSGRPVSLFILLTLKFISAEWIKTVMRVMDVGGWRIRDTGCGDQIREEEGEGGCVGRN